MRSATGSLAMVVMLAGASCGGRAVPAAPAPAPGPAAPGDLRRPPDAAGPFPVAAVVDGDTVKVHGEGRTETVRVIGLDTPETRDPRKPVQCFGREASDRARALLDGRSVWLESDPSQGEADRYGRRLAHVWIDDTTLLAFAMIHDGFAHEYTYDRPYRHRDVLTVAERDAEAAGRGLWGPTTCAGDTQRAADPP